MILTRYHTVLPVLDTVVMPQVSRAVHAPH